jgi:putative transcriptional regulator
MRRVGPVIDGELTLDALEDVLTAGSGVRLPAPLALLVESKRVLDGDIEVADVLGGALLEAEAPAELRADTLDDVMREIEVLEKGLGARKAMKGARGGANRLSELAGLPEPVRAMAADALSRGGWRFAAFGISSLPLVREGDMKAELIRIEPGAGVAQHDHLGREYTLVLQGAYNDGLATFARGDVSARGPGELHRPRALEGEVCFTLAVSEAPMLFGNFLDVIQKLTRH